MYVYNAHQLIDSDDIEIRTGNCDQAGMRYFSVVVTRAFRWFPLPPLIILSLFPWSDGSQYELTPVMIRSQEEKTIFRIVI